MRAPQPWAVVMLIVSDTVTDERAEATTHVQMYTGPWLTVVSLCWRTHVIAPPELSLMVSVYGASSVEAFTTMTSPTAAVSVEANATALETVRVAYGIVVVNARVGA